MSQSPLIPVAPLNPPIINIKHYKYTTFNEMTYLTNHFQSSTFKQYISQTFGKRPYSKLLLSPPFSCHYSNYK